MIVIPDIIRLLAPFYVSLVMFNVITVLEHLIIVRAAEAINLDN